MAIVTKFGSFTLKDAQGNVVTINGLTANDIAKVKQALTDISALKQQVEIINAGRLSLAYKDFFTDETHKAEMVHGVYYKVPFKSDGTFIQYDKDTGRPTGQTEPANPDLTPAYYEIVYLNADGTIVKLGRASGNPSLEGVVTETGNHTITGSIIINGNQLVIETAQDVDSLADTAAATAKWVRDYVAKVVSQSTHLVAKFADGTDVPLPDAEGTNVTANNLVFYAAKDQLV